MHKEIEYLTAAGNRMGGGPVHQSQAFYSTISGSDYGWEGWDGYLPPPYRSYMFPLYISYSQLIGDNTNLVEQSYQHFILIPQSSNPIIVS